MPERERWPKEYQELLDTPYVQSNGLSQLKCYLAVLLANRKTKDQSRSRWGARLDAWIYLNGSTPNPHRLAVGCGSLFYAGMCIPHSSTGP